MAKILHFDFTSDGKTPEHIGIAVREAVRERIGERLTLELREAKRYSTDPQRRYYFEVIVGRIQGMLLMNGGQYVEKEELHDWLMWNVGKLTKTRRGSNGEKMMTRRSYMDLSTIEAEEYHTKCRMWAAERGCDIPEPNEQIKQPGD